MEDNIYTTDTEMKPQRSFSRGFRVLLGLGIFLTGFTSVSAVAFVGWGISDQIWREMGACQFAKMVILYGCILCCFVFLLKKRRPILFGAPHTSILFWNGHNVLNAILHFHLLCFGVDSWTFEMYSDAD